MNTFIAQFQESAAHFWENAKDSPKTSGLGAAGIIGAVVAAVADWRVLSTPLWWTELFVSAGLLFSPDHKGPDQSR